MKGLGQMESGFIERQMMHGGPQVEHVALSVAVGVETLKNVLAEMGGEGALRVVRLTVNGTATTALQAAAAQVVEQSQVFENLLHRYLLTEESKVHLGTLGGWRRLDGRRRWRYGSSGRGDHFFCGQVPFVAHGCFISDG